MTAVQSILLNYEPKYNPNKNYQSNGVSNQFMFAQQVKTGTTRAMEKRRGRDLGETWIILYATNVEKNSTMMVTVSDPLRRSLKRMRRHSGRWNRKICHQDPWWKRPKGVGKHKRHLIQSYDESFHQGMRWPPISWTHFLPNLNTRTPTDRS